MTQVSDFDADAKFIPILDHGFVRLVDHMGSDAAIVESARVSYGKGTKSVREDRGLIRYLVRHSHTSPLEQCVVKFHMKMPIFVARQLVRHRTSAANEHSGRYSIMPDEFYVPEPADIAPQSGNNRQGRDGTINKTSNDGVRWLIETASETNHDIYKVLLGELRGHDDDGGYQPAPYDPYHGDSPLLTEDFPGVARELARIVLPLNTYTELYWTQNLHNLFHLLKLRMDAHAQYEIRVLAEACFDLIQPLFPEACAAFVDYRQQAVSLSRMDRHLLADLLGDRSALFAAMINAAGGLKEFAESRNMSVREVRDFAETWGMPLER